MLRIDGLAYRIGGRTLFDGATMTVPSGHKVGLVGRNGAGKSTLFRLITGEVEPDAGTVGLTRGARIGCVAQEAPGGAQSLLDTVLAADGERAALLAEADTPKDTTRLAEVHERLAGIEAHSAPARAAAILAGLGFDEAAQGRPCGELSGGWRMRVALARALFGRADLLLLDEPTNHLDLEATLWLEAHLARRPGTVIVISHERTLLNQAVGSIVHLDDGRLTLYSGGYDRFERTRIEALRHQSAMKARQLAERKRIQAFVDRFRAKATKARQAQSRLKMLARMEPIASVVEEKTVTFDFPEPEYLAPPLVALDGVAAGYSPGKEVLADLNLRIDMDDRIALLGANGNGKSTLVKIIAGRLQPLGGKVVRSRKLSCGYFAQHQAEELEPLGTPFTHVNKRFAEATREGLPEARVRAHLGRFGFAQDRANVRVSGLSGGEKARLLFAMMCVGAPHLILLDEPTNHLDVDAREALVQAINAYPGAVILVSHDAHLIDLVCDRLWLVAEGTCQPFDGSLDDYRQSLLDQRRVERRSGAGNGDGRRRARRARAAARAETAQLRRAAHDAEARMADLQKQKESIESELADPKVYAGLADELTERHVRLAEVTAGLAAAETAWIEAHEALEDAKLSG
jgi:ATP-binding cassette subfamily F protein 3